MQLCLGWHCRVPNYSCQLEIFPFRMTTTFIVHRGNYCPALVCERPTQSPYTCWRETCNTKMSTETVLHSVFLKSGSCSFYDGMWDEDWTFSTFWIWLHSSVSELVAANSFTTVCLPEVSNSSFGKAVLLLASLASSSAWLPFLLHSEYL